MVLPTNFDENLPIRLVGADILSNDLDVEEQTVDDVNRFRATSFCNATKSWSVIGPQIKVGARNQKWEHRTTENCAQVINESITRVNELNMVGLRTGTMGETWIWAQFSFLIG